MDGEGPTTRTYRKNKRPKKTPNHKKSVSGRGKPNSTNPQDSDRVNGGPLRDLLTSSLPDPAQLEAVETCLEHVQILARQLLGETAAVVVQGSYAQGLALRGSDLDIAVIVRDEEGGSSRSSKSKGSKRSRGQQMEPDVVHRQQAVQCLQRLAHALSDAKLDEIRIALRIFSAKVPVLRLHCGAKGGRNVVVDVSVGGSLLRGACDRAVYAVLQQDPSSGTAAALCRLVKLWAKRRKLTNTLKGGLSSFAFVLLTIFFLQRRSVKAAKGCSLPSQLSVTGQQAKPANPGNCCPEPLGLQVRVSEEELILMLVEFFKWATEELPKFQNRTISIGSATAQPRTGRYHPLFLEVPFSPEENAARCLRIDVWEGVIHQELSRGNRLVKQLAKSKSSRESRLSLIRTLFSASDGGNFQPAEVPEVTEAPEVDVEREDTKTARRSAKRRRKFERRHRAPQEQDASKVMPETVAPVDRWLGLRSLLDPR